MDYAVIYSDLKALLAGVSEKIGEGAGFAWEIVVHQQFAIGITKLIWASLFLIPIICLAIITYQCGKQAVKSKHDADEAQGWICVMFLLLAIIGGLLIGAFGFIQDGVLHVLNPQYYAIEFFVNAVKTGTIPQ